MRRLNEELDHPGNKRLALKEAEQRSRTIFELPKMVLLRLMLGYVCTRI